MTAVVSAFRWVPPFAEGFVRDHRVRWALEEIGRPYDVALVDGEPYPHVHGVFSRRDFTVLGGHVLEAIVSIAVELAVLVDPAVIRRQPADFCDLKLIEL